MTFPPTRIPTALALLAFLAPALAQERAADRALVVIDLRPQEEKAGKGLAPLAGKCNEDVYRIADAASNPLKVTVLKTDLARQLGVSGKGKTLTVLNWTIYYNRQLEGGEPWAKIIPVGGSPLPGRQPPPGRLPGSRCSRQESGGGWFEHSEVTGTESPLISIFEGTYAGTPVGVRIVHSPKRKLAGKFKGDTSDSLAVIDAAHETADALAAILPR